MSGHKIPKKREIIEFDKMLLHGLVVDVLKMERYPLREISCLVHDLIRLLRDVELETKS